MKIEPKDLKIGDVVFTRFVFSHSPEENYRWRIFLVLSEPKFQKKKPNHWHPDWGRLVEFDYLILGNESGYRWSYGFEKPFSEYEFNFDFILIN